MKKLLLFTCFILFISIITFSQNYNLSKKWESTGALLTPESVLYFEEENILFVANINGKPTEKDQNGCISKVNLQSDIIDLKWAKNLHAPKGMGIFKNVLYVTDIDRIAEIELESGKISGYHEVEGAQFLNDISVSKEGVVYVSDMYANRIYKLKDRNVEIFLDDKKLVYPNGLNILDNDLYIGTQNTLYKVNLNTKEISAFIENTGSIDGLKNVEEDMFIISDWSGKVHLIKPGKEKQLLLDTEKDKINAADFEYINKLNLLIIPTFFDNRVMAYELKK